MHFFTRKKTSTPVAVFDISSSSVGAAHVLLSRNPNVPSTVLAQARVDAALQEDINLDRFVTETMHNLEAAMTRVRKADVHHPQHIQLMLASPWYVSQTRTVVYKKDAPFVCTKALVESLVSAEIAYVLEHDMGRFGAFGKEGTVVERQLSLIKLNGYATAKPYGKKAQSLELYVTITVAPKSIIDKFIDIVRRTYGVRKVGITTSLFAEFIVARDHINAGNECMVIDVGEEITDVSFVKDGLFLYQHSFPIGTYGLYRAVSDAGNHTPLEAMALIESYRHGKITGPSATHVEHALVAFTQEWQTGLRKLLDEGQYGFCISEQCYIAADPRFEQLFTSVVATDAFVKHACSQGAITPTFFTAERFRSLIATTDGTDTDAALAVAALFVARIV